MDVAAVLLTADGKVIYVNPAAERMLRGDRGLSITRNRLKAADAARQRELDRILGRAGCSGREDEARTSEVWIEDVCGNEFSLRAIPVLCRKERADLHAGGVVVLVHDCTSIQNPKPYGTQLREQYGLTDTEVRLVCHLIEGRSVRDAAARMKVAYETARSYLKSVFRKTDTHRQVELLQRIARAGAQGPYAQNAGNDR